MESEHSNALVFSFVTHYINNQVAIDQEIHTIQRKCSVIKEQIAYVHNDAVTFNETTSKLNQFSQKLMKKIDKQFLNYERRNEFTRSISRYLEQYTLGNKGITGEENLKTLQTLLKTYNDMLSLDITFEEQMIKMKFTNIDNKNPQKEFELALNVQNSISVNYCNPKIEKIDDLVHIVCLTADWHSFLVSVRKHFVNMVKRN